MVLKLSFPKQVLSTQWIERYFARHYKQRKIPLDKFITLTQALQLTSLQLTSLQEGSFLRLAISSKVIYGVDINGNFLFHPDGIISYTSKKYQRSIAKLLADDHA